MDGREIKLADPAGSGIEWQLTFRELVDAEIASLLDFFALAEGRLNSFTFLDPTDNLLAWSEQFDAAVWQRDALLEMSGEAGDPMGLTAAFHLLNRTGAPLRLRQTLNIPGTYYYAFSIWVRSNEACEVLLLRGAESTRCLVSADWKRVVFATNSQDAGTEVAFGIEIGPGTAIEVFGAQVEAQIGASAYKKTCSAGGIYPTTRFRDNSLTVSMLGPGRHNCTIYLRTK